MASFSLSPGNITPQSLPRLNLGNGNSSGSAGNSADQMREVLLGQIISNLVIKAVLSFDDPVTTEGGGVSSNPSQSGVSSNPPQSQPRPGNQTNGSAALTSQGGLSFGGGARLGDAGVGGVGLSAVGTTTINKDGYQTSGGITAGGISANAGVSLNSGGLTFTGGIQKAQVGQGIVGSKVGSKIVGP